MKQDKTFCHLLQEGKMEIYYYFSIMPEALIASMLTPEEFCTYFAVGSEKRASGQAILFEVFPDFKID